MKTPTITIDAPVNKPLPSGAAQYAGFRFTLRVKSGGTPAVSGIAQKLVWTFEPLQEGETYAVLLEAVDKNGRVIVALPEQDITVPSSIPADQYPHPVGFSVAWA